MTPSAAHESARSPRQSQALDASTPPERHGSGQSVPPRSRRSGAGRAGEGRAGAGWAGVGRAGAGQRAWKEETAALAAGLRLVPPRPVLPLPAADAATREILNQAASGAHLVVLGAAGTGKSTLALRLLLEHVAAGRQVLLLAPTRARADRLRERAARLGGRYGRMRVATPASYAFQVLRTSCSSRPDPVPVPVLLRGAEEDAALARLLDPADWPQLPEAAVRSVAFRGELRNLLARCGELGVGAGELAQWGRELGVPAWESAAGLLAAWDTQGRISAQRRSQVRRIDSARVQDRAIEALARWREDQITVPAPVPDLVVVDDYQDCTQATARLLAALAAPDTAGHRAQVVVLGDPDVAVETFRGGSPSLLTQAEDASGLGATRLVLGTRWRGSGQLAAVWEDQADRVPVSGTPTHRHPVQRGPAADSVETVVASSPAQEAAHVARMLREEHVHHGTPWQDMVVIVRSAGRAAALARDLRRRGVPLAASTPAVLLRREQASAALLDVARAALDGRLGDAAASPDSPEAWPDRDVAIALLTGPLVGLSLLDLRRLRRRLRQHERDSQGEWDLCALLADVEKAEAFRAVLRGEPGQLPEPLEPQAAAVLRAARIIEEVREVASVGVGGVGSVGSAEGAGDTGRAEGVGDTGGAEGAESAGGAGDTASAAGAGTTDIEQLLWAAWKASGRAWEWRRVALSRRASDADSLLAEAAEHHLDVVTTLFKRAENWAQQHPGTDAAVFLDELAAEVLPSDSVAPHGNRPAGVSVITPALAAGGEWEVVAVTGVGRDVWPDLRVRDTLTRTGLLVDVATGRMAAGQAGTGYEAAATAGARADVRGDERRMFLAALTRATRRLVVTSVADAENQPSTFFLEVAAVAGTALHSDEGVILPDPDTGDLTLRGLVGELRRALVSSRMPEVSKEEQEQGHQAARLLARLAQEGVPGADPGNWLSVTGPSSSQPLVQEEETVRVSPSDVEALTTCPLRWFLQRHGAGGAPSGAQALGTLVHALAEQAQRHGWDRKQIMTVFESKLPGLGYPDTWVGSLQTKHARDLVTLLASYLESVPGPVAVERAVEAELSLPAVPLEDEPEPDCEEEASQDGEEPGEVIGTLPTAALDAAGTGAGSDSRTLADGDPMIPAQRVRITGRVDRLEYLDAPAPVPGAPQDEPTEPGRVRLIDLKTGAVVYSAAERHPQLATYRLALESLGYEVDGAALVLLGKEPRKRDGGLPVMEPSGAVLDPSPDPDTGQDWAVTMLARAAYAAAGVTLTARTGEACRVCAVKDSCPVQIEGRRTVA